MQNLLQWFSLGWVLLANISNVHQIGFYKQQIPYDLWFNHRRSNV